MAALDSYRSEHEKAVAGKDKIIENLKQHMQHSERSKASRYGRAIIVEL